LSNAISAADVKLNTGFLASSVVGSHAANRSGKHSNMYKHFFIVLILVAMMQKAEPFASLPVILQLFTAKLLNY
jgi:hypothetical protein